MRMISSAKSNYQRRFTFSWGIQLLISGLALFALTGLLLIQQPVQQSTTSLFYVLMVIAVAVTFGRWQAIVVALGAGFAFNYFFMVPQGTLLVLSFEDGERLIIFISVALIAGSVAGHARNQAVVSMQRAAELDALYRLSQTISAELSLERMATIVAETTTDLLRLSSCSMLVANAKGDLLERVALGTPDLSTMQVELANDTSQPDVVLRVSRQPDQPFSPADRSLLETIAAQFMRAVERSRLAEALAEMRSLADSDRLKSTLLSSVSHDLNTPLAIIKGAATNLLDDSVPWDKQTQRELLLSINGETDRLNRLVRHLLEMSRIEAGTIQQTKSWQDPAELLLAVLTRLRPRFAQHTIEIELPADLPLVCINYVQIDHVLTNLIENAANHAAASPLIQVRAEIVHNAEASDLASPVSMLQISVADQGPGIPDTLRERIFEKFVRAAAPERSAHGSGLGLAICKGLVEAHHGRIWFQNRQGGGTIFCFQVPVECAYSNPS